MSASKDKRVNVVIVGAGPAGTACAAHLGTLSVGDVVLTDRHDFPRDKTCGSGLSPKGIKTLRDLGVWHEIEPHSYPITGIRLVTQSGEESYMSAGTAAEAVVCERRVLDHKLLLKALSRGAVFVPDFNATDVLTENGRVAGVRSSDGVEVRAKIVVIAGGAHCRIGQPEARPRQVIQAIMGWWSGVSFREGHVEMIFDEMLAPYYGWLFPEGPDRVNIGITYEDTPGAPKHNARELFQRFLDKHYKARLADAKATKPWKGHPIVWNAAPSKLTRPGAIIVGEAGLMTHPATAEGIYQGMRSGMLAAEAIADTLRFGVDEAVAFRDYERACNKAFRGSFVAGVVFRKLMRTRALDWVLRASKSPGVESVTAKLLAAI